MQIDVRTVINGKLTWLSFDLLYSLYISFYFARWPGTDRSNGFEKMWFESRAKKAAMQEHAYKWSTEDM